MNRFREYLKQQVVITDGSMGTYYNHKYDTQRLPELDNLENPDRIINIHKEYIMAGAKLIRTNTYASNCENLVTNEIGVRNNILAACEHARTAASDCEKEVFFAGDIGPVGGNIEYRSKMYLEIVKVFIEAGVDAIVFETFPSVTDILDAVTYVKDQTDIVTMVQFAVDQFGYSGSGRSARSLVSEVAESGLFDVVGLNCGIGPGHMKKIISQLEMKEKMHYSALPNAGYPHNLSNRKMFHPHNIDYFAEKLVDFIDYGVGIVGGCCGTDPLYIKKLSQALQGKTKHSSISQETAGLKKEKIEENAFYKKTQKSGTEKLIAVELAPPVDINDEKLMDAVHGLKKSGADVLTFPDSPSGRTRIDSILMAEKAYKETGMCVMPHICCRDKNAIALRSSFMGAHINGIRNFLLITGDPVPTSFRQTVKSVFNFDATGLMQIAEDMNETVFAESPIVYGGAINHNRRNLHVEVERVKKKMKLGATFFFTQPVFDEAGIQRIREIKEETGAKILVGIMPFVSKRNATFMKNEMTGIEVPDDVIALYEDCVTKEDGERVGVKLARQMMKQSEAFADGFYFSFPFNRVYLLEQILNESI